MKTPDVPVAWLLSLLTAVAGLLAAFGLPLTTAQETSIRDLVLVLSPVIVLADLGLRAARAKYLGPIMESKAIEAAAEAKRLAAIEEAATKAAAHPDD